MPEQPALAVTTDDKVHAHVVHILGFGIFAALAVPLVIAALLGERIDAGSWIIPLAVPAVMAFRGLVLQPPVGEEARQAADISRWDVS